jgi:arabinofuranosyltransferase
MLRDSQARGVRAQQDQADRRALPGQARIDALGFLLTLVVFGALVQRFWGHTVDDAFISFRYAENFVAGHGLVFNPGERVEGYTNFLWVMAISPFLAAGADPVLVARILGVLASLGTLLAVFRFGPRCDDRPEIAWVAPILVAANPAFCLWATGGLETPLFACLVAWAIGLASEGAERGEAPLASAVLAGLAALTRPEGALVAGLLALALLLVNRRREFLLPWLRYCAVFAVIFLPYFAWRWTYYDALLPNTFYAKVGVRGAQVVRGLQYTHGYLLASGYWLLLPMAGVGFWRERRKVIVFSVALVGLGISVILVGGDALPMYRFWVPLLAPFYVLFALGCGAIVARSTVTPLRRGIFVFFAILVLVVAMRPAWSGPQYRIVQADLQELKTWRAVGRYFFVNAAPGNSIAILAAGAIPYYSKLKAVDMLGLNDATIGRRKMPEFGSGVAGHEKYDVDYVLSRRPTFVVVGVYRLHPKRARPGRMIALFYEAERKLLQDPRFAREYRIRAGKTEWGWFPYFERIRGNSP